MRSHPLFPSLLLLGALSLTAACSSGTSGTSEPPGSASAGARPGPSPSPARTVDPSKIKGLKIVTDSSEHTSCRFAASYPDVPGAEAMTNAMKKDVEQRLSAFRSGACTADSGDTEVPDFNISHQFLVASGDVLGVRLTTWDPKAAGSGLSNRTYWYDGEAGEYRTALGLVADGSQDAFIAALKDELKVREGVDAATLDATFSQQDRTAVLDDIVFTDDGGLRVEFDRGEVTVTRGADGALASLDGERVQVPAVATQVVDTVGAGDSFTAGLLHHLGTRGLLGGRLTDLHLGDVEAACLFATQVAALTCSVAGPNPPWEGQLAPFATEKTVVQPLDSTH